MSNTHPTNSFDYGAALGQATGSEYQYNQLQPQDAQLQLAVDGMTCQNCANRIEKQLSKHDGITSVSVNFAGEIANVSYDTTKVNQHNLINWIKQTGFTASVYPTQPQPLPNLSQSHHQNAEPNHQYTHNIHSPFDQGNEQTPQHPIDLDTDLSPDTASSSAKNATDINLQTQPKTPHILQATVNRKTPTLMLVRLVLIWLCAFPFLFGMFGMLIGQTSWMPNLGIQLLLATIVQFVLTYPFYRNAWYAIKAAMASMDVLIVLATLSIWSYSCYVLFSNVQASANGWLTSLMQPLSQLSHPVYFEAAVMIFAFVSLGKYLEQRTKRQSLNIIELLLSLTPDTVERQSDIGDFHSISIADVTVGDVLRAKQGSRIAADGVVIEGVGWCNESHLTGESDFIKKQPKQNVLAGALVENGSLLYQVQALGIQSQFGNMVHALSEAQGSKADIARLADKVSAIFVPLIVLLASITAGVTYWLTQSVDTALLHAASVLVIACPCALGLATPAAIMVGMGVAARHGIWFKDAQSLERAGNIDTFVIDKTGTLTAGKPTVVSHVLVDKSINIDEVLQLTASVEAHASHPLATALVTLAIQRELKLLPVTDVQVFPGMGIQGHIEGLGIVKVGNESFVNLPLPKVMPKVWNVSTPVAVSINDVPLGMFALSDEIKEDAKETLKFIQNSDMDVILMSGDKKKVTTHIADQLGILQVQAQLTPQDKAEKIAQMQAAGQKVAMVGDGVNDALALTTAHASFAVHGATHVAQHSASARLMGGSLIQLYDAHQIAAATNKNIKQNLFFAFIYNLIAIPLAAFGLLTPVIAASAMALSSLSVLFNALRLKQFTPRS